jgi:CBS-domain-containing membrane protein
VKTFLTILFLAFMNDFFGIPFLMAPFGASTVLSYTNPDNPFAKPINIFGGYFICGAISLVLLEFLPHHFLAEAVTLMLCAFAMGFCRLTHPPAGAIPVVVYYGVETIDFWFLVSPIMCGSATLVALVLILDWVFPTCKPSRDDGFPEI